MVCVHDGVASEYRSYEYGKQQRLLKISNLLTRAFPISIVRSVLL